MLVTTFCVLAQNNIERIDPPFWWVDMNNKQLQIMVYGDSISTFSVSINYPEVEILSVEKVENPNYIFINLEISSKAKPGKMDLLFVNENQKSLHYEYELKPREIDPKNIKSFSSEDVVYLIMPDRFANGDPTNDSCTSLLEKSNRLDPNGRHGGDIQGIINNLDYIQNMGFTSIWLTPVCENNSAKYSYHGYAISDYYKIDGRYGTNKLYQELSKECNAKGIKLIIDMVTNHCSTSYFWNDDLPTRDWYNGYPNYKKSNFIGSVWSDPYKSNKDVNEMANGWFDSSMADLNHNNPFVAKYLIQNTIWWIEYAGLDGVRSDTHMFNDKEFTSQWCKAILDEYPTMNIVGEVFLKSPSLTAYWQKDSKLCKEGNSFLPTIMDIPLYHLFEKIFDTYNTNGFMVLYEHLSKDFLYEDKDNILTVADNHDVTRLYSLLGNDMKLYKMAISFLLTTRGIPQMYYGCELAFSGKKENGDPDLRHDFPGGWENDNSNGFSSEGLSFEEKDIQDYMKKILNWRKQNKAVKHGQLMHFIPMDGVYVYFRYIEDETVMVVLNGNDIQKDVDMSRFEELVSGKSNAYDVVSGDKVSNIDTIKVEAKSARILELH